MRTCEWGAKVGPRFRSGNSVLLTFDINCYKTVNGKSGIISHPELPYALISNE